MVDNASTDGSLELLDALHGAALIHLIRNRRQRDHGPALTQAISWLARRQREVDRREQLDYVWLLDSDVIVLRPTAVCDAIRALEASGAAAVGQAAFDPWHRRRMLQPFSLLIDPAVVWRSPPPAFEEDDAPAAALQLAAEAGGLRLVGFPFVEEEYLLHLGRGTRRQIADSGDVCNRYYEWAVDHRDYHFASNPAGPDLYRTFGELFGAEVASRDPDALVDACRNPALLGIG